MNDWDKMVDIGRGRKCEWFFDVDTPKQRKCGEPAIPGKSYCPTCYSKAYYIPKPKKKKAQGCL